ncbi:L,D-transpeptidase [Rhodobacteraceae bacterium RKSG542]|uniref:L,D-transpeptidase n=1 Tax=Pseudovibrio flavus TaxID=2529854 RepID=UPI0012BBD406|nr:L,D-transpeptidase [Pseudovibrio flavus]MTI16715.1 L,D-transpeptidase [Pseudovibrio flavus]
MFLTGAASLLLAGCASTSYQSSTVTYSQPQQPQPTGDLRKDPYYIAMYAAVPTEKFPIPAVNLMEVPDSKYLRQVVAYNGPERAGTIVVDPNERFLYLVRGDGSAMRYGVGVGRAGFEWAGDAVVKFKRPWPRWTPPASMIARQPKLEKYRNGMEPGLHNPLGARALYLFHNGQDTLYRIHGTNENWSIGRNVSSGCIRMLNQDIIDLYNRVPSGTRVVVRPSRVA